MDRTELTLPELDIAREAGAAPEFLTVAAFAPRDAGAETNSAAVEVRKRLDYPPNPDADHLDGLPDMAGDFTGNLWNGNLGTAFIHADIDNLRLLSAVFSRRYLIERVIEDEHMDPEYAATLVTERLDEHASDTPTGVVAGP